jgi:CDP-paratose 2-epimerase
MKILITGGCGFIGSNLAIFLKEKIKNVKITSVDNLSRKGSRLNHKRLSQKKIKNFNSDIGKSNKLTRFPKFDLIIHCAAEPAIEASRKKVDEVFNSNLIGTFNVLKKCAKDKSNIIYLSSSRVYAMKNLFKLKKNGSVREDFNVENSKSIYGFTKLSSELLIKEYSYLHNIKYIINRVALVSGPWQFGKQDQGFVSLWVWRHLNHLKLSYIGFGGTGRQVRDVLHIQDLCELILLQIQKFKKINNKLMNVGGGKRNSLTLLQLTGLSKHVTKNKIKISSVKKTSPYDVPYFVTNTDYVTKLYKWKPKRNLKKIVADLYFWMKPNISSLKKYF